MRIRRLTPEDHADALAVAESLPEWFDEDARRRAIPIVAVPFMGEVGRRACEEAGVGWIDLSGNARIIAEKLRVLREGQPNRFRSTCRTPDLFAPKSSRVARWLLMHPDIPLAQRTIASATGMDEGFVSRIVSRLLRNGWIVRDARRAVRLRDPGLFLDAWREAYRFEGHEVRAGHVAARSGEDLLGHVCRIFAARRISHAATGLAAAWAFTRFAAFRLATVYVSSDPPPGLLGRLGFRDDPRGANLWLVIPNDSGVFHGTVLKHGVRCVHPVQAYLDLKAQPERAAEASDRLRAELLTWRRHA
jgi:hypothetical protein